MEKAQLDPYKRILEKVIPCPKLNISQPNYVYMIISPLPQSTKLCFTVHANGRKMCNFEIIFRMYLKALLTMDFWNPFRQVHVFGITTLF